MGRVWAPATSNADILAESVEEQGLALADHEHDALKESQAVHGRQRTSGNDGFTVKSSVERSMGHE